jgi:hypothetical protein
MEILSIIISIIASPICGALAGGYVSYKMDQNKEKNKMQEEQKILEERRKEFRKYCTPKICDEFKKIYKKNSSRICYISFNMNNFEVSDRKSVKCKGNIIHLPNRCTTVSVFLLKYGYVDKRDERTDRHLIKLSGHEFFNNLI